MSHQPENLSTVLLDARHLEQTIDCVASIWAEGNVIARALGVTQEDYLPVARAICTKALEDELGLLLLDTTRDEVVGFSLAIDLVDELAMEEAKQQGPSPLLRRWGAMLRGLLQHYLDAYHRSPASPLRRGEVLYGNIGGVVPAIRSKGLVGPLVTRSIELFTRPRGYRRVVAIATHPHSIRLFPHLGFKPVAEVSFASMADPDLRQVTEPRAVPILVLELPG